MILKTLRYDIEQGIATVTFDEQGSPVNTMCLQWQDDLAEVAQVLVQDRSKLQGVILASNKSTFFAGADLKGVMRSSAADGPKVFAEIERIKKSFRTIETLGIPAVSCLNGSALGGGWEVALIGHHRIATRNPKIQFGLPEVTLGLIPGGGGITKMTRALGLLAAQPYILESKLFGSEQALKLGLVHELVETDLELRKCALAFIAAAHNKPEACLHIWDRKDYKMPGGTPHSPKMAGMLSLAPAALKQKTRGLYPAPVFVNGIAVHRQGDGWNGHGCAVCLPHGGALSLGSEEVFVNTLGMGRVGDAISCGSTVAAGSGNVFAGP